MGYGVARRREARQRPAKRLTTKRREYRVSVETQFSDSIIRVQKKHVDCQGVVACQVQRGTRHETGPKWKGDLYGFFWGWQKSDFCSEENRRRKKKKKQLPAPAPAKIPPFGQVGSSGDVCTL